MTAVFDPSRLTEASRQFAARLLARHPELTPHCAGRAIAGTDGLHLVVHLPSPAGTDRDVVLWLHGGTQESIGFGQPDDGSVVRVGWHVHEVHTREVRAGQHEDESILDLLDAILADEFVLVDELGPNARNAWPNDEALDLRRPDALLDALTDGDGSGRIRLRSFTGRADRDADLGAPPA